MVINQTVTDRYAIYNSDNMYVLPQLPDNSIDLSIYSPPFATKEGKGLYCYSSHINDLSNSLTTEQFLQQYEYMVEQIARITKPGRISAVHCSDIICKDGHQWDFPHEIELIHERHGFKRFNKITIWKEPLKVRMRTMVDSLMHKMIVEDSTECFTAMPDYVLIFKKVGKNEIPVTHPVGLRIYAGEMPILPMMKDKYGTFEQLKEKYRNHDDPKTNKLSHIIWQRYASSVWDDIRIDNVVEFEGGRDEDDEKHVHPLQKDVYHRLLELYSNPNETLLEPFHGVGSGTVCAIEMGRKCIGIELKESYYNQSLKNIKKAKELGYYEEEASLFSNIQS